MIATSRWAKLMAATAAVALHGTLVVGFVGKTTVEVESGAGAAEARIGSSFADMAAGTLSAEPAEEMAKPVAQAALVPPTPVETPQEAPQEIPQETPPEPMPEMTPEMAKPVAPAVTPSHDPQRATVLTPAPQMAAPVVPQETVEAQEETSAPSVSMRPKQRTRRVEKAAEPAKKPAQKKAAPKTAAKQKPKPQKKAASAPKGNAKQTARAGSATGREGAKSAKQGVAKGKATREAGNARASNYPGQVMKKLSRVSRPRVGRRGTAVVAFTIAPNGRLAAVSIAKSSGHAELDRAALRVVQRAAPFPPPPQGARRSYSINIKGG